MQTDWASLSNLKDISEPAAVGLWPLAPGMVLLGLLCLVWAATAVVQWRRHHRRTAYRRIALRDLAAIESQMHTAPNLIDGVRQISVLLKRVALAAYPRVQVARLSGARWSTFLDGQVPAAGFNRGPGQVLDAALVQSGAGRDLSPADGDSLVQAARLWIAHHPGSSATESN